MCVKECERERERARECVKEGQCKHVGVEDRSD